MQRLRTALLLIAMWSISAAAAHRECVQAFGPLLLDRSEYVFDGTVLRLDGTIAQMLVHRVFKGRLPARLELYAFESLEDIPLVAGERYVMAIERKARRGSVAQHRPFTEPKDDPTLVWGSLSCGAVRRDRLQREGELKGFGRGWPAER